MLRIATVQVLAGDKSRASLVIGKVERRHNRVIWWSDRVVAMVSDLDIWRAAELLVRKLGANAEFEAAKRADLMLDRAHNVRFWKVGENRTIFRMMAEVPLPTSGNILEPVSGSAREYLCGSVEV